jgi:hypothetical protein
MVDVHLATLVSTLTKVHAFPVLHNVLFVATKLIAQLALI